MIYSIVVTERCNLNCKYCYEDNKNKDSTTNHMTEDQIQVIYDFIKNNKFIKDEDRDNIVDIVFYGGEPLLNWPFIKKTIAFFEEMKLKYTASISTNLTCVNDEILDYLYNKKIRLHISIDGERKIHDLNRIDYKGNGSFQDVIKNIKKVLSYEGWNNSFNITLTPDTVQYFSNSFKMLKDMGIQNISAAYCGEYDWTDFSLHIFEKEMEIIANEYINSFRKNKKLKFKYISDSIIQTIAGSRPVCLMCSDELAILPSGDVLPCGAFVGNKNVDQYVIGSIYTGIDDEAYRNTTSINLDLSECEECVFLTRCHNTCYALNQRIGDNISVIPKSLCDINQICLKIADNVIETLTAERNELFLKEYNLERIFTESN